MFIMVLIMIVMIVIVGVSVIYNVLETTHFRVNMFLIIRCKTLIFSRQTVYNIFHFYYLIAH